MDYKSAPVRIKSVDEETGIFEALVSVFGNKDSYGDVVMPGAFTKTLAEWAEKGDPIPVYWSHRMDDPDYNIGHVLEAKETEEGLYVKSQLDLGGGKADQVHRLLKGRRVTQFSFAYDVIDGGHAKRDDEEVYELRELKLYEVGPTPIGANQETELLAVKAAREAAEGVLGGIKAGRVLAQKHIDSLRSAQEAIGAVIAAAEADQEKASGASEAKVDPTDEDPATGKSAGSAEEPTPSPTAKTLATRIRVLHLAGEGSL
jgi:HK97 family phage prohead protease